MHTKAFIITPYAEEYNILLEKVFIPALSEFGIKAIRAEEFYPGSFYDAIAEAISGSDIIISDISDFNANVFVEIGWAKALNKNIIILCRDNSKIPKDLHGMNMIRYNMEGPNWEDRLCSRIMQILDREQFSNRVYEFDTESPLEIYFKYRSLALPEITNFLSNLNSLHGSLLSLTSPIYYSHESNIAYRNNLLVDRAFTGNSVNFSFKEGWLPEFNSEQNDINIKVPKKLGIPALIGIALLSSANQILDIHNKYLDAQIKEIDLKSKKIEYSQKVKEAKNRSIKLNSNKIVREFQESKNILHVEINNIPIISGTKP